MSAIEVTLDTNILFYAFDPADNVKHVLSRRILNGCIRRQGPVALQCLSEFYRSAIRKHLVAPAEAARIVGDLSRSLNPVAYELSDVFAAIELHKSCGFQFFDCQIVATVARIGCTVLLTEDMQHGRTLDGVEILNPFMLSSKELDALIQ